MEINDLPVELLLEILRKTDGYLLAKCRQVCRMWMEIIDGADFLWQELCEKEFYFPSKLAKKKSGHECQWYHIYRNLKMWGNISSVEKNLRDFYRFNIHDKFHALDVDYNILPLRDARGFILYEISTWKYLPVTIPERNCLKISNNDRATSILTKSGILLQRSEDDPTRDTEAFFKADNSVLTKDSLYFYNNRDIYRCSLLTEKLVAENLYHCDYDIKEMQVNNDIIYLFSDCGKIITVSSANEVSVKPMEIPYEWIKQIKYIKAFDDKQYICYSRNLFKIEINDSMHLFLDFPPITALFFYGDIVIIGTRSGEILLYKLSSQRTAIRPIFEDLAVLPDDKYAVHLDVVEKKSGPVIIIATFFEIMLLELKFFPHEQDVKRSFSPSKLSMYKRLLKLRDRMQSIK